RRRSGRRLVQLLAWGAAAAGTSSAMSVISVSLRRLRSLQLVDHAERPISAHACGAIVDPGLNQSVAGGNHGSLGIGGLHAPGHSRTKAFLGLTQLLLG